MEYQGKDKEEERHLPSEEEKASKECPNCHSRNEVEAQFCGECGFSFSSERKCPKCGAKVLPNADICERCGEWLLVGKCKFCYADLEEGAKFCSECGNPTAGIVCPQCGQLSNFDFCKHCNIPLTALAQKMIEKVKNRSVAQKESFSSNQETRRYFMAQRYISLEAKTDPSIVQDKTKNELLKLKSYIKRVESKSTKKKSFTPLFSEKQKEDIKKRDKKTQEERRKQEEERRKRFEGWHCNTYNAFHRDGPCGCAAPSGGGHWESWADFLKCVGCKEEEIVWRYGL